MQMPDSPGTSPEMPEIPNPEEASSGLLDTVVSKLRGAKDKLYGIMYPDLMPPHEVLEGRLEEAKDKSDDLRAVDDSFMAAVGEGNVRKSGFGSAEDPMRRHLFRTSTENDVAVSTGSWSDAAKGIFRGGTLPTYARLARDVNPDTGDVEYTIGFEHKSVRATPSSPVSQRSSMIKFGFASANEAEEAEGIKSLTMATFEWSDGDPMYSAGAAMNSSRENVQDLDPELAMMVMASMGAEA